MSQIPSHVKLLALTIPTDRAAAMMATCGAVNFSAQAQNQ